MNFVRTTTALLVLAAIASTAYADPPKTREEVRADLREAVRTGDVYANGDSGMKLNELYPERYPHLAVAETKTRADVKAEFAEAVRVGTLVGAGESGLSLREETPGRYPAVAVAAGRTRQEVRGETLEAIHNGEMTPAGEGGGRLQEESRQRYASARAFYTAQARAAGAASAATR